VAVVSAAGVFVLDAKNYTGRVERRDGGGLIHFRRGFVAASSTSGLEVERLERLEVSRRGELRPLDRLMIFRALKARPPSFNVRHLGNPFGCMVSKVAQDPFPDELARLLKERGLSARALSDRVGVNQSYLSLVVRGRRRPSRKLLEGAAKALELPADYFREYRELVIMEAIRAQPDLLSRVYVLVTKRAEPPSGSSTASSRRVG